MRKNLLVWLLSPLFMMGAIAKPCPPMEGEYTLGEGSQEANKYYDSIRENMSLIDEVAPSPEGISMGEVIDRGNTATVHNINYQMQELIEDVAETSGAQAMEGTIGKPSKTLDDLIKDADPEFEKRKITGVLYFIDRGKGELVTLEKFQRVGGNNETPFLS